ncbi:hypothetical protein PspLS_03036 [Pyricularia sp. CBS 133598]|nr:hypothetical protein PspLS_03036 [Pyricularia sp. CBS 133598]
MDNNMESSDLDLTVDEETDSHQLRPLLEPTGRLLAGSTEVQVNREVENLEPAPPSFEESQAAAAAAAGEPRSDSSFAYLAFSSGGSMPSIRSHNFSNQEINIIDELIVATSLRGIDTGRQVDNAIMIKLRNYDTSLLGDHEVWPSVILAIFNVLTNDGWVARSALPITKSLCEDRCSSDTMYFKKQASASPLSWSDWMLMSFDMDKSDKPKLFGDFPSGFIRELRNSMLDVGEVRCCNLSGKTLDLKVKAFDGSTAGARKVHIAILEFMESFGFSIYSNFEMKLKNRGHEQVVFYRK